MSFVSVYDLLRFFSRSEFSAPDEMDAGFLLRLDFARKRAGVPFVINSSFRAGDEGQHGKGLAVDLHCVNSFDRFRIVKALLDVGFERIGVYPRHVHVDAGDVVARCVMWHGTYSEGGENAQEQDESREKP